MLDKFKLIGFIRGRSVAEPIDSTGKQFQRKVKQARSEAKKLEGVPAGRRGAGLLMRGEELSRWSEGIKRESAHGGCLGIRRRRRTRQAAKIRGEAQGAGDPRESEWDNPPGAIRAFPGRTHGPGEANPANRNIQVAGGEDINRDSPSSGERTGISPNRERSRGCRTAACRGSRDRSGMESPPSAGDRPVGTRDRAWQHPE